jgi:hypothetical protein
LRPLLGKIVQLKIMPLFERYSGKMESKLLRTAQIDRKGLPN